MMITGGGLLGGGADEEEDEATEPAGGGRVGRKKLPMVEAAEYECQSGKKRRRCEIGSWYSS